MDKRVIKFFMIFMVLAALVSCTSTGSVETANDKPQRLSIDELKLDWINSDITVDELEKSKEYSRKEVIDEGMYLAYEMENFKYVFTADNESWGESALKLVYVEIFKDGGTKLSGPREIRIGDDFNSVLEKFPQDQNWEDSREGVFYGEAGVSYDPEFEKGSVTEMEDGSPDFITLVPKGYPPFIKIHFENDHVIRMIIYYMTN